MKCWATSGWLQRNPYLQDDLLDNPKRRGLLVEALRHRLGEIERRRTPGDDAARDALVGEVLGMAEKAVKAFDAAFQEAATLRAQVSKRLRKVTAKDNIKFDGLSRVAHVTGRHRLAGGIPLRGADPRFRG